MVEGVNELDRGLGDASKRRQLNAYIKNSYLFRSFDFLVIVIPVFMNFDKNDFFFNFSTFREMLVSSYFSNPKQKLVPSSNFPF